MSLLAAYSFISQSLLLFVHIQRHTVLRKMLAVDPASLVLFENYDTILDGYVGDWGKLQNRYEGELIFRPLSYLPLLPPTFYCSHFKFLFGVQKLDFSSLFEDIKLRKLLTAIMKRFSTFDCRHKAIHRHTSAL